MSSSSFVVAVVVVEEWPFDYPVGPPIGHDNMIYWSFQRPV